MTRIPEHIDPTGVGRVIDAYPRGVFDRAAMQAVERYKYRPRVVNGEAITVTGIRQRIEFELSDRSR